MEAVILLPWLFNEDEALRNKLQGVTVTDANSGVGGRPVPVRFRFPETPLATTTFPMITIEWAGLNRATDREMRGGWVQLPYSPEGYDPLPDPTDPKSSHYFTTEFPIPYDIDYTVTTYARLAQHDRTLIGRLMQDDMFHRFGYLEIPQDGTVRRVDTIGGPYPADVIDNQGKRLFRKIWTVRVSTELLPSQIYAFNNIVTNVTIDLEYYTDTYDLQFDKLNGRQA